MRRLSLVLGSLLIALVLTACTPIKPSEDSDTTPLPSETRVLFPENKTSTDTPDIPTQTQAPPDISNTKIPKPSPERSPTLIITAVLDNRNDYKDQVIPKFKKFEVTFQVQNSVAQNFQFPYDPTPPPGINVDSPPYQGITVNAVFTPDNWKTTFLQPAFYYQDFLEDTQQGKTWYYPTNDFAWKARFSPDRPGIWQYKLTAQDTSGLVESDSITFQVIESSNPGFIRVSQSDSRYFEFENGENFPALGYNLTYNSISWINPVTDNEPNFQRMSENGIQLGRFWLSQWGIFGSAWNPWKSIVPKHNQRYLPLSLLSGTGPNRAAGSESSMIVNANFDPCMFIGWLKARPAVKPNTNYRVRVRYLTENISGPRVPGNPYGLVAKLGGEQNGGWLFGQGVNCHDPGTGIVITNYQDQNTVDTTDAWRTLEGSWHSGRNSFLPFFYIAMENVESGRARIDYVWIEEELGNGDYGPNIISKPWMSHHLYFEQRNSFALDKVFELSHQTEIYLRPVLLEKMEWALNHIQPDGTIDDDRGDNNNFYGEYRQMTKTRWLQQAWWRYVQARWGYSPNIHSWELLNEGDPFNDRHYTLADEFGKYMKCWVFDLEAADGDGVRCLSEHPNAHMVSTSTWHSFPADQFWASHNYPNIEFADVHAYISTGWLQFPDHQSDIAAFHLDYSYDTRRLLDTALENSPTKPIVRGELGIDSTDEARESADLKGDIHGVWLHNLLWASVDSGGLIEHYWWTENIETNPGPDGEPGMHEIFAYFQAFIQDIPLNNGRYEDSQALASDPRLRVYGQKDLSNQRAHLWVQNTKHTWRNVVDGRQGISGLAGTITLDGFQPEAEFPLEWHTFTTQGLPDIRTSQVISDIEGQIIIELPSNSQITDIGIKIGDYTGTILD